MIEVRSVYKQFGGVHAVENATLKIERGSITGLIGPNGAGKTTTFNVITGLQETVAGSVTLDGVELSGKKAHQRAQAGIASFD